MNNTFKTFLLEKESPKEDDMLFNANALKIKAEQRIDELIHVSEYETHSHIKYLIQLELLDTFQAIKRIIANQLKPYKTNEVPEDQTTEILISRIMDQIKLMMRLTHPKAQLRRFLNVIEDGIISEIKKDPYDAVTKIDYNDFTKNSNDAFGRLMRVIYAYDLRPTVSGDPDAPEDIMKRINRWMAKPKNQGKSLVSQTLNRKRLKEEIFKKLITKEEEHKRKEGETEEKPEIKSETDDENVNSDKD